MKTVAFDSISFNMMGRQLRDLASLEELASGVPLRP